MVFPLGGSESYPTTNEGITIPAPLVLVSCGEPGITDYTYAVKPRRTRPFSYRGA